MTANSRLIKMVKMILILFFIVFFELLVVMPCHPLMLNRK
jgi:hypothetical protein